MLEITKLHERAVSIARYFRIAEVELIQILQKMDENFGFRELGFPSLYRYCVESLKLSESQSYRLITIARKSLDLPELQTAIANGTLNTHKACRIVSVINDENKEHWIKLAGQLSQRELERVVQGKRLRPNIQERIKYHSDEWAELTCEVDHELVQLLERAKDVHASKKRASSSVCEVMKAALRQYLDKEDPVVVAERNLARRQRLARAKAANSETCAAPSRNKIIGNTDFNSREHLSKTIAIPHSRPTLRTQSSDSGERAKQLRRPIPAETKHEVHQRDGRQCAFVNPDGKRCAEKRWTEIHHVQAVALGGENELANLITMCSSHHKHLHT